jgi:hypothetical protein
MAPDSARSSQDAFLTALAGVALETVHQISIRRILLWLSHLYLNQGTRNHNLISHSRRFTTSRDEASQGGVSEQLTARE